MADITMCEDKECPFKETCYRFTATPSEYRQSYFKNSPYNSYNLNCEDYWPNNLVNKELNNKIKYAKLNK